MKIAPYRYRCSLGKLQSSTPDVDIIKRDGWRQDHILVVREDDERLDFVEREFIRRIGNRLYGTPREGTHG